MKRITRKLNSWERKRIMYITKFDNTISEDGNTPVGNGAKLFDILQDALIKGLKGMAFLDAETIMDIKRKINDVSTPKGEYCSWCGHIMRMPAGATNWLRKLNVGEIEIKWSSGEIAKIREVLEGYPKPYEQIEECVALVTLFKDAPKEDAKKTDKVVSIETNKKSDNDKDSND